MKNPIYQQNTATLAEVALRAGVSRQTAGRILGAGAHKHKPVTVEKVKQAAEELGYRPNLLAKGVVAGRTFSVGVLMPRINNDDFFARVITGIQDALAKTDLIPLFMLTSRSAPELEQLHRLIDRRVDGILLIPEISEVSPDYFMEISRRNIPVVCINSRLRNIPPVDYVATAEFDGGKAAAEHLLAAGHTRLCSIRFGLRSENLGARHDGFKTTVRAAGAHYSSWKLPGWTLEENLEPLLSFLRRPERPGAFFCATDIYAAQLYRAAGILGLNIPGDFSVVGFSDLTLARYLSPPLTTLRQDGEAIGRTAVQMLLERIGGLSAPARDQRQEAILVKRESVRPIRAIPPAD